MYLLSNTFLCLKNEAEQPTLTLFVRKSSGFFPSTLNSWLLTTKYGGVFFPIPSNSLIPSRHKLDVLKFHSVLTRSTWRQHQIPQVKDSVPTRVPPFRHQTQVRLSPIHLTNLLYVGVLSTPSLGLITCQNGSQNSGKHFLCLPIYYKRLQLRNSQTEEMHTYIGQGNGGRSTELCAPSRFATRLVLPCIHQPGSSSNLVVQKFL